MPPCPLDPGPWTLGWEAIGAIVSGLASIGALYVAALTRRMAKSAQETATAAGEEAAGAWRPLMLFEAGEVTEPDGGQATIALALNNEGRGPALAVRCDFKAYSDLMAKVEDAESVKGMAARATVKDGERVDLMFNIPAGMTFFDLAAIYDDLGGRTYSTRADLTISRDKPSMQGPGLRKFRVGVRDVDLGQLQPQGG